MTPVRFALVGAGSIAQSYAAAFETTTEAKLVAVADVRADAAAALAQRFSCPHFRAADDMAGAVDFEAAVVCTPPSTHCDLTLLLVEHGRHVLCEKPFCLEVGEAEQMVDAATRAGVKLTMASKFRYADDVIRAKSIVTSGILGEIVLVENSFTARVDMANRWNSDPRLSGGGVLIDNGTHSLDIMRYLLGPLADVQVVEGKRVQGLPVEDTVRIFARSEAGVMAHIDLSWSIDKQLDWYLNIYGSHGTVTVGWKGSRYRQFASRDWIQFGKGYDKVWAFRNQINNFARAIRGEEMLLITAADALASVEAVASAYEALHHSHWTSCRHDEVHKRNGERKACAMGLAS